MNCIGLACWSNKSARAFLLLTVVRDVADTKTKPAVKGKAISMFHK